MKAKFLALAALVLGLASCQTDTINGVKVDANGEAPVTIQVGLPEEATRAAGNDSGIGAIGNVNMNEYDIRFILEVYDAYGALAKERQVVSGDATTATFSLRLVPGRHYRFVAWADFVEDGSKADLHYNTHGGDDFGLTKVELKSGDVQKLNDETRDAYTGVFNTADNNGEVFSSSTVVNFKLTRPFAKLRVVTNDMNQLYSELTEATVTYETKVYTSFNALLQKPGEDVDLASKTVVYGTDTIYDNEIDSSERTLFADYLFGTSENVISFTLDVKDETGFDIPTVNFNTSIPVQRNHLTTIYGPVLTDANNVTVEIQDSFENSKNPEDKPYYVEIISGVKNQTMELTKGSYLFEDVTFNVENAAAIVVKSGNVVMDLMGVMNINAMAGIVVEDGATLTINGVGVADTRGAVRAGNLIINASNGSAIGGDNITINNLAGLTAKANDNHAFGIGSANATVNIENTKIDYVCGGHVQPLFVNDTKYGKSEPEGGAAIGGANVVIKNSTITKAEGGSKAAAIGNKFWESTNIVIENSTLVDIFGGNASAAIGGSRFSSDISADNKQEVSVTIKNSTITNAVGGQFGAGIGSGYDTHCAANATNSVNNIVIEESNITAKGGKYSAGIGTGFHAAALTGSIDVESTINATSCETFYKDVYTIAQNIGYGIIDPAREGKDLNVTFTVAGQTINIPGVPVVVNGEAVEGIVKDVVNGDYNVSGAEGFYYIAEQVNAGNEEFTDADIVLNNDIDLSQYAITRSAVASNWTPIGTEAKPFTGTFDGNGCTIKNLALVENEAKEGKAFIGFFGYAKNATIKNVTFENVYINIPCLDIDHSQGHIGAVAGSLEGTSTIENVTVKGDIKVYATQDANGASRVAVVAGGNSYGNVTMKNVHVIANEGSYLIANNNTGALAGQLQGKMVFENCYSNIDVTVNKFFAGGLVGIAAGDSYIKNCHTTGNVSVVAGRAGRHNDEYRVGGIAGGWADGKTKVFTLEGCTYSGELYGANADGAVVANFDYAGYVGRGYTLANCAGSTVIIDGVYYIQKEDTVYGVYVDQKGNQYVANGVIADVNGIYYISSKAGMFWFANEVNVNKNAFSGKTVKLTANIDLNNAAWTPVGQTGATTFNGVFDGQDFTISNLNVNSEAQTGKHYSSGLFGWVESHTAGHGHIKNVKINGATIVGHHNCGALVGYITQETALVENCHVTGATVSCTKANNDADGDKAGALIGNATVATPVKNCTAANSTVSAGRDAGQVIGAGKEANVTGCSATDVTVSANGTGTGANVRNEVIGRLLN